MSASASSYESAPQIWLPDFFTEPSPETLRIIEQQRLLKAHYYNILNFPLESDERRLLRRKHATASTVLAEFTAEVTRVKRAVPVEQVRAIAEPLLQVMTEYGQPNDDRPNLNTTCFHHVQVKAQTESGLYVTTEVYVKRQSFPEHGPEHVLTYDEVVALRDEKAANRKLTASATDGPIEWVVDYKIYASTKNYPVVRDISRGRPPKLAEGSVTTDGPAVWARYPGVESDQLAMLRGEDFDQLQRFTEQFPTLAEQQAERVAA